LEVYTTSIAHRPGKEKKNRQKQRQKFPEYKQARRGQTGDGQQKTAAFETVTTDKNKAAETVKGITGTMRKRQIDQQGKAGISAGP